MPHSVCLHSAGGRLELIRYHHFGSVEQEKSDPLKLCVSAAFCWKMNLVGCSSCSRRWVGKMMTSLLCALYYRYTPGGQARH